jgi:glycosyltransferase involved in cell wall biosynthesis
MKILHTVESYLPARHGMAEVVRQISEHLAAAGHQVTVATSSDPDRREKRIAGVDIVDFDIRGSITGGIQGEYDRYINFLLNSNFDIVTNFHAQQWATDLALPILDRIRGKKVFVPTGYSALYLPEFQLYYNQMKEWLTHYDKVVYLSNNYRDVNFSRDMGLSNGVLIPNGASETEFSQDIDPDFRNRLGIPQDAFLVIHISGYIGGKGHIDAIKIYKRARIHNSNLVFICPDFEGTAKLSNKDISRLIILSMKSKLLSRPFPEKEYLQVIRYIQRIGLFRRDIKFINLSRNDVVQMIKNADLFLFPSHLECSPVVLFEAMAAKTPFLSTNVGNVHEIISWSHSGMLLPTVKDNDEIGNCHPEIHESAMILKSLALDSAKRIEMGNLGYSTWQERFTWEKISKQYEEMYINLLNN